MHKFKVGDRVLVMMNYGPDASGEIISIHRITASSFDYRLRMDAGYIYGANECQLTLCKKQNDADNADSGLFGIVATPNPYGSIWEDENEAAPCLNLEVAPHKCDCEFRSLLMNGCTCGGY